MNRLNLISASFCLLSFVMLTACCDVNPIDTLDDSIDDDMNHVYAAGRPSSSMSESDKCYYGTSAYSDQWCCSYYGYRCNYTYGYSSSSVRNSSSSVRNSSSSVRTYSSSVRSSSSVKVEVVEAHTSKNKTLMFTLTYYKQRTSCWDDGLCLSATYSDGDPTISFTIYFIASGGQSNAKSTGNLISLQDQGTWSGVATKEIEVPVGTQDIKVCPSVIDKDVLDNDNKSSGNCYTITNVGYLEDYSTIEQSDSKTAIYTLKWEWYLY